MLHKHSICVWTYTHSLTRRPHLGAVYHTISPSVMVLRQGGSYPRCVGDSREWLNVLPKLETGSPFLLIPKRMCIAYMYIVQCVSSHQVIFGARKNMSQLPKLSLFDDCRQRLLLPTCTFKLVIDFYLKSVGDEACLTRPISVFIREIVLLKLGEIPTFSKKRPYLAKH